MPMEEWMLRIDRQLFGLGEWIEDSSSFSHIKH